MAESNPTQVILTDDGIKIIKAQNTADNAASGIKNINDPNYLSPFEKPQLQVQMDNFATIYAADKDIATSEGIDFTAYEAAYQAYVAYMTPLIADMTTYSPIVRATFNSLVTAVQAEQKRFNAATQAQYNQQMNQAKTDIANGQTKYEALQSEAKIMESSAAGIADKADQLASKYDDTNSLASQAFGKALSAQNAASSAVNQASSAAADSKDSKQIAGAVSQSYKTLTDGSTMTIAELQNGLGVKLTKTDLNGYATETWAQNQIKITADGINGAISSVKNTVNDHTTNIHDIQADSKEFKSQFTTYKNTVDRHDTDIGTLQRDSKSLSSNFDSLDGDNKTNQHNIGELQQSSKDFSSTLLTVQSQVQNSAVGTNLLANTADNGVGPVTVQGDTFGPSYSAKMTRNSSYIEITNASVANELYYRFCNTDSSMHNLKPGQTYTIQGEVYVSKGSVVFRSQYQVKGGWVDYPGCWSGDLATNTSGFVKVKYTFTVPSNATAMYISWQVYGYDSTTVFRFRRMKLEVGSNATDYSTSPLDNATVTAVSNISQTVSGLQSTVSDKVSSSQLTQLSGQLTNQIKDFSSSVNSKFTQTANDINGLVKKGDVVSQFNLDAGGALLSTSGDSTKIVFSSPNIIFDSANPVQIPNANIPGILTGKTFKAGTITATTNIKGADIEAPLIHSPSGSFKLDGNTGDIIGASIHSADNSWGIDKNGIINGSTLNGATINTPTLNLGTNGTLTTDFNINQDTSLYAPKKGTGTLTIKTGVINSRSQNMSRYSNTAAYWYGFDNNGNMVKNGTNQTGDDYAPGYEKHDIMKSNGSVLNRSYLDAMGLMFSEGGNSTYNTMLTGVGLETAAAKLHKDLATDGTFEAALGTDNTYGFSIGSKVVAPMVSANKVTYSANMFISKNGYIALSTSTKANKLDIVDVPDMLQKGYNLLTINPRQWFDKASVEAYADVQSGNTDSAESVVDIKPVTGMVAEEVASAGLDDYVIKDENNKVQGLAYDRLWTLLLPVLRDMNDKINKLQKKEGI